MSYRAKRVILLVMLWGLLIFTGVHVKLALSEAAVRSADSVALTPATPTAAPDRVAQLQATLDQDPQNGPAMLELAGILYAQQDFESALTLYQRAQQLNPHDVDLLLKIGVCQLYTLRFDESRETLTQASDLDPSRADAHLLLGLALSKVTPPQIAAARAQWTQAIQLAPGTETATQAQTLLDGSQQ